jgi:hypothetical protein
MVKNLTFTALLILLLATVSSQIYGAQSKIKALKDNHFGVGDFIGGVFVLDKSMQRRPLLELIRPETKLAIIILFGGGMKERPAHATKRGPLWCEDSFDDLGVQRALMKAFGGQSVQFIGIAIPPVYHSGFYGWPGDPFLDSADQSEDYQEAVRSFIDRTQIAQENDYLPFDVYYDPRNRLAENPSERSLNPKVAAEYSWQGKFRWPQDLRQYGTPTIWFLDSLGKVLRPPLLGNDYDGSPPEINYGFHTVKKLIEDILQDPVR